MTDKALEDMGERLEEYRVDIPNVAYKDEALDDLEDAIDEARAARKELKRHIEALKHVFERARLARLNVYDNRDDAYEYLVQIREKEEALKRGDEILEGKEKTAAHNGVQESSMRDRKNRHL